MFRSFLRLVQAQRQVSRASIVAALVYAVQAVVCTFVVVVLYSRPELGSVLWAVVSAVLVLQPGLRQSYGASATRFISNLIGALTGALVDKFHGHGPVDVMVALVLVVGFCEVLRLDQGLRSACASVAIVMMSVNGAPVAHATELRLLSVLIGCATALAVQIVSEHVQKVLRLGESGPASAPPPHVDEG